VKARQTLARGILEKAIVLTLTLGLAFLPAFLLTRPGNAARSSSTELENSPDPMSSQATNASSSLRRTPLSGASEAIRTSSNPPHSALRSDDIQSASTGIESRESNWLVEDLSNEELPIPGYSVAPPNHILPDSEVVFSPGAKNFDISAFVNEQGGFLDTYREQIGGIWMSGAEVVELVALQNSVNPRLLLALLEYRSGWLTDPRRPSGEGFDFPIQTRDQTIWGLHMQLTWAAGELSRGYYDLKAGSYKQHELENIPPGTNAGTVALDRLLKRLCLVPDCTPRFMAIYYQLFGDPWEYEVGLYNEVPKQPTLILPFPGANEWIFTGGPHGAWGRKTPWAALDFAPMWDSMRRTSDKEVVAVADGVIARVDHGVLVLDLDGDGYEQTGWSILYLHISNIESIKEGTYVRQGQIIGLASKSGGVAVGEHIHIARKYNGEWILAGGSTPFDLGGWRVKEGAEAYQGQLYNDDRGCRDIQFIVPVGGTLRAAPMQACESYTPN
jgi:hypothetical protein